jgi:hypothetical protein
MCRKEQVTMPSFRVDPWTASVVTIGSVVLLALSLIVGCGGTDEGEANAGLPRGSEQVDLRPGDFSTDIDNPYWPMTPGSRWVYREVAGDGTAQRVDVTVTDRTRRIANGIEAPGAPGREELVSLTEGSG